MSTSATAPDKFTEFVLEHENDDTARLLLSKGRWKDVDIDLAVNTILSRRKLRDKVPAWYSHAGLVYPAKLSAEQCSSQDTAGYKAGLALRLHRGQAENCSHLHRSSRAVSILDAPEDWNNPLPAPDLHIADLTGGLGVDSWAFSKVAGKVFYNEMDQALAHAARHNFLALRHQAYLCTTRHSLPDPPQSSWRTSVPESFSLTLQDGPTTGKKSS